MAESKDNQLKKYNQRADLMFLHVENYLKEIFCKRYLKITKSKWEDGEKSGKSFSKGMTKSFYKTASPDHKKLILSGSFHTWQPDLLCDLLLAFRLAVPKKEKIKQQSEDNCIREIGKLYTKYKNQDSSKIMTETEFNEMAKQVTRLFITLGMPIERVKQRIEGFSKGSDKLVLLATSNLSITVTEQSADSAYSKGNHQEAVELFTEALSTFTFTPSRVSDILSKRGLAYVQWSVKQLDRSEKRKYLDLAFTDAKEAIKLKTTNSVAYHVAGICYGELEEYVTAFKYLDQAIAIEPTNGSFRDSKDLFTLVEGNFIEPDPVGPPTIVVNFLQAVAAARGKNARYTTDGNNKAVSKFVENLQIMVQGKLTHEQEQIVTGYQNMYGWGKKQDLKKACTNFQVAAKGFTESEAKFYLAMIYAFGNINPTPAQSTEAFQIVEDLAVMDKMNPADLHNGGKRIGVAESLYLMGMFHESGTGSFKQACSYNAALFYKKAHESGLSFASAKLGFLYFQGKGVVKSVETAEYFWKHAVNAKHWHAYAYLLHLYIFQMEYAKAREIAEQALKTKNIGTIVAVISRLEKKMAEVMLARIQLEPEVKKFEDTFAPLCHDEELTFVDRLKRSRDYNQILKKVKKLLNDNLKIMVSHQSPKANPHVMQYNSLWNLGVRIACDSVSGKILYRTCVRYHTFCSFLKNLQADPDPMVLYKDTTLASHFVTTLYKIFEMDSSSLVWDQKICTSTYEYLIKLKQFKKGKPNDEEFRRKLNLCLAEIAIEGRNYLELGDDGVDFLVSAWTLDSESIRIASSFANHYLRIGEADKAYLVGREALERFGVKHMDKPDMCDLVYTHAIACSRNGSSLLPKTQVELKVEASMYFEKFIEKAPIDHKNLPEAYYNLGLNTYDYHMEIGSPLEDCLTFVKHFLEEGRIAEKYQLQCFLPYQSSVRHILENIYGVHVAKGMGLM